MSTEATRKTRGAAAQSKDVQDASDKGGKEDKSGGSKKNTDPSPSVRELDTQKTKEVMVDPKLFQVVFYMKHFRVTDILVKVVDRTLIIDACHREHADEHGLVSRSVIRKQKLPKDVKLETLISSFTGNGFLVIHAERSEKKSEQN